MEIDLDKLTSRLHIAYKKFYEEHFIPPKVLAMSQEAYKTLLQRDDELRPMHIDITIDKRTFIGAKIVHFPDHIIGKEFELFIDEDDFIAKCSAKD